MVQQIKKSLSTWFGYLEQIDSKKCRRNEIIEEYTMNDWDTVGNENVRKEWVK